MRTRPLESSVRVIPAESVFVTSVVLVRDEVQQCDVLQSPETVCNAGRDEHPVTWAELIAEFGRYLRTTRGSEVNQGHMRASSRQRPQVPLAEMEVHAAQHTRP